jgi:hypothetical protein
MFRLVGVGEQAGSGVPKIYRGWATQHWRAPALYERVEPYEQTLLELWMFDLLPASVVADLRRMFGRRFDDLHRNERLAVVTAATERVVTHARVREMTALHPFDITRMLQNLVRDKFLEPHNSGRGAVYCLPGVAIPTPEEVFRASSAHSGEGSAHLIARSAHLPISSAQFGASSAQLSKQPSRESETRDPEGRLLTEQLDAPVIDSLDALEPEFRAQLEKMAAAPRAKAKLPAEVMKSAVLDVCRGHYLTLGCLSQLVNRDSDAFRQQYLKPLAKEGRLKMAFPTVPTHAKQAYRTAE